jgi:2-oxoglutarate dehydrogenase E2 component (dihydrolipoamide succinyltransferase)
MKQVQIVMPQMGQSVAEGTIVAWKKSVGDEVEADEVVVEVETDKTTVDVESPAKGRLAACLKRDGEIAAAGEAIGVLETEGEDDPPLVAATNTPHAGAEKPSEPLLVSRGVSAAIDGGNGLLPEIDQDRFSPYVLRMALLNNVSLPELKSIRGSGRNGRLTKNDLLQYLGRRPVAAPVVAAPTDRDAAGPDALSPAGEVVPMSSLRRTIADHMVQSIHTSAHVTMVHAVDMTHVVNLRERIKDGFQKKYNAKMTYTAVLLFVTSRVLSQ